MKMNADTTPCHKLAPCYTDTLLPCLHAAEEKPLPQSVPGTENESESFHLHNTTKLGCLHPHLDEHFFFLALRKKFIELGGNSEEVQSQRQATNALASHPEIISLVSLWVDASALYKSA